MIKKPLIGFIHQTRGGKFKPMVGYAIESEGDNDSFIHVVGSQPPQDTLDQAQKILIAEAAIAEKYLKPIPGQGGIIWLNVIKNANKE